MTARSSLKGSTQSNGASLHMSVRIPRALAEVIEEWATKAGMPTSRAVVRLAELGLQGGKVDDEKPSAVLGSRGPRARDDCAHPRGARKNLGYATICGECGQRL